MNLKFVSFHKDKEIFSVNTDYNRSTAHLNFNTTYKSRNETSHRGHTPSKFFDFKEHTQIIETIALAANLNKMTCL